jgi:hypothetical protein
MKAARREATRRGASATPLPAPAAPGNRTATWASSPQLRNSLSHRAGLSSAIAGDTFRRTLVRISVRSLSKKKMAVKAIADRVEALQPIGAFLGHPPKKPGADAAAA